MQRDRTDVAYNAIEQEGPPHHQAPRKNQRISGGGKAEYTSVVSC